MGDKLKTIPLCQLQRAKINVRKTEPLLDIGQLATDIADKGLLENLIVRPGPKHGAKGAAYEVTAGGRRLAALKLLAKRGTLDRTYGVRCLVRNDDDAAAVEVSLSENFSRLHLHPADQFEAFAVVCRDGASVDDIAARFFSKFLRMLSGYHVNWKVVECDEVGIPQTRSRLVLVASRRGAIALDLPKVRRKATVEAAIGKLPQLGAGEQHPKDPLHVASRLANRFRRGQPHSGSAYFSGSDQGARSSVTVARIASSSFNNLFRSNGFSLLA